MYKINKQILIQYKDHNHKEYKRMIMYNILFKNYIKEKY